MNLLVLFSIFLLLPLVVVLIVFVVYQSNIIKKFIDTNAGEHKVLKQILKEISDKIEDHQKFLDDLNSKSDNLEKRLNNKESIDIITKKTAQSINEVISLYKQGFDIKTIASRLHRGDQEIELILKRFDENRSNL